MATTYQIFADFPDHRVTARCIYSISDLLTISLITYLCGGEDYFEDCTMLRGLPMDFPTDRNVADISDQWMLGPALMPCPVSEYKSRYRSVYFPQCEGWYDFYTGRPLSLSSVLFGNNIPHVRCRRTPLIPLRQHFRAYSSPRRAIAFVGKFIARR